MGRPFFWRAATPVVFLLAGLVFVASAATARGTDLRGGRLTELSELIEQVDRKNDAREAQVAELRRQVEALTDIQAQDRRVSHMQSVADHLEGTAGLRPLTGQGLTVRLDDAPADAEENVPPGLPSPTPDDLVVHEEDVHAVVNALWAGGAEAMQIMDQRLISTSAVRCVGNTLILQGRVYSPPYTITALGDPRRLAAALNAAPDVQLYKEYVAAYGLGYDLGIRSAITVPGYSGSLALEYARVPES
ncbi:MAG: DUF881 domain-containing protein [Carbonactinosporaceae bacterium]